MTPPDLAPAGRTAPLAGRCVLLFARSARGEAGAKRLGRAAAVFAASRRRVAAAAARLGVDLVVVGPAAEDLGPSAAPAGAIRFFPQHGATFAERLGNAFAAVRGLGYRDVVAVPTDVPLLAVRHLAAAFAALAGRVDAVLGPSPDGGVYLIGVRGDAQPLLAGVRWRTSRVLGDLAANAGAPVLLDLLRDLDHAADLRGLAADLAASSAPDPDLARLIALLLVASASPGDEGPSPGRSCLSDSRLPSRAPPATFAARV